jgi:hypothetical protein
MLMCIASTNFASRNVGAHVWLCQRLLIAYCIGMQMTGRDTGSLENLEAQILEVTARFCSGPGC